MNISNFFCVALFFLLLNPEQAFSQDILYKKDSSVLKVNILNFDGKTIRYQIPGASQSQTFSISKRVLDSARYSKGELLDFTRDAGSEESPVKLIYRNNVNLQAIGLLRGDLSFEYERISKRGKWGIVAGLFINTNEQHSLWTVDHYQLEYYTFDPFNYFVRMGVNYYPFNSSLVRTSFSRFSTGFSLLIGSFQKEIFNPEGFENVSVFASALMLNIEERVYAGEHFQITGRLETSILPFLTFLCPQLGLSYGF